MANSQPAPAPEAPKAWEPPTSDQEFKFKDIASAPSWVDKSWASYDHGPALAVPVGNLFDTDKPYTTASARVGDTVKFVAALGSVPAHFEVITGAPDPNVKGMVTKRPPQESGAPLESLLQQGYIKPDDLSDSDKAKVAERGPLFRAMVEEGKGLPKEQKLSATIKTS
jgi:hypothetical protein